MGARTRRLAADRADAVLAALALLAIAGIALTAAAQDDLGLGEGEEARTLRIELSGPVPADSAPFRVAQEVVRSRLESDPSLEEVRLAPPGDGRTATLVAVLEDDAGGGVNQLRDGLDPGILTASFGGGAARLAEARESVISDLVLLLLALPLVAALWLAVLGRLRSLGAAIAVAAATFGSAVIVLAISAVLDLSVLALAGAGCGGLVALHRYASEEGASLDPRPPWAALAAAAALAAPALLGVPHLASLALGAVLAALLALPAVALAAPAAAELWGPFGEPGRGWDPAAALGGLLGGRRAAAALASALSLALIALLGAAAAGLEAQGLVGGSPEPERLALAAVAAAAAVGILGWAGLRRPGSAAAAALSLVPGPAVGLGAAQLLFGDETLSTAALVCGGATVASGAALAALGRPGIPVTLTALTGALAGLSLTLSPEPSLQQFGAVVAAGLLADLLLVRSVLRPAGEALAGDRVRPAWPTAATTDSTES